VHQDDRRAASRAARHQPGRVSGPQSDHPASLAKGAARFTLAEVLAPPGLSVHHLATPAVGRRQTRQPPGEDRVDAVLAAPRSPGGPVTDALLASLDTALDGTGQLVGAVTAEQWDLPTPCADWTVRQLVNHLVGGNRLFIRVLRGEPLPPPDQLGRRGSEDQLGNDPATAFRSSAHELLEAVRTPGVLERTYTVPAGTLPGPAVVHLRTVETLVHGWDLARATGQRVPFPDELAQQELTFSRDLLGRLPEGRQPFGPSRPVADDAPAVDRLAALLGRSPDEA
jgi:uncharacterized protein (TIGR03086 family)